MVCPILISVSVTPGAFSARAPRKPWAEYAAAAADCNRKRRVIMLSLPDDCCGCVGLARIHSAESLHLTARRIFQLDAVTQITRRTQAGPNAQLSHRP